MGKSKDIDKLQKENEKFQAYLEEITKKLQEKAKPQFDKLSEEIENFYEHNGWTSEKFIGGENIDFMHSSVWSLEKLKEVINIVAGAIFGGTSKPEGIDIDITPDIGKALAAMENLELYLASRVLVVLSGVLEAFGNSNSITFKTQYKQEALGNGFHMFTVMACDAYDSQGFLQKEKILEYIYAYEIRFSTQEAESHAKIALIDALTDAINACAAKIKAASKSWVEEKIGDAQYASLIDTYKTISETLTEQLKDLQKQGREVLTRTYGLPALSV
ncbi:hypothetical protein [Paracidobacterium acidisoli]|uniref:Uncharacterized protein n=1 Tax=Paracidobacterium acidisoli TaxID=2303751 RepID=A0A372IIU7_9BACT|nr:hypothetical protein [Paracidobacterium acidisoli]MBT9333129.1 hypothetical protein [Paracidobacterium acidisoli]